MKLVFADAKSGFVFQKDVDASKEHFLIGKKIGEKQDGSIIGLDGYELLITGGTDKSGFPMRRDIMGVRRVKALLNIGPGIHHMPLGKREKRQVVGNTISETTAQVNVKITNYGPKSLEEHGIKPLPEEERKKKKAEKAAAKAAPKARKK